MTGVKRNFLHRVIGRYEKQFTPYKEFLVRKKSGGLRSIRNPVEPLKQTQQWMLKHILNSQHLNPHCYGVSRTKNSVACARQHCGARWLLKLDIHDFFANISEQQVYPLFLSLGYAPLVAFELTRLATYPVVDKQDPSKSSPQSNIPSNKYPITDYWCDHLGSLPQGAPTSSSLANLFLKSFDKEASLIAYDMGWHYTRYVDDISLSSSENISRRDVNELYHRIKHQLPRNLSLNPKKTSVCPPGSRKIVMGLLVDGERPRLTHRYRNNVELHLHYCELNGVEDQARFRKFRSPILFLDHLQGKISYAYEVDPVLADRWATRLCRLRETYFESKGV